MAGLMLSLAHGIIAPCNLLPGKVTKKERKGEKHNFVDWGTREKEREKANGI